MFSENNDHSQQAILLSDPAVLKELKRAYQQYLREHFSNKSDYVFTDYIDGKKDYTERGGEITTQQQLIDTPLYICIEMHIPRLNRDESGKLNDNREQLIIDVVTAFKDEIAVKHEKEQYVSKEEESLYRACETFSALATLEKIVQQRQNETDFDNQQALDEQIPQWAGVLFKALQNNANVDRNIRKMMNRAMLEQSELGQCVGLVVELVDDLGNDPDLQKLDCYKALKFELILMTAEMNNPPADEQQIHKRLRKEILKFSADLELTEPKPNISPQSKASLGQALFKLETMQLKTHKEPEVNKVVGLLLKALKKLDSVFSNLMKKTIKRKRTEQLFQAEGKLKESYVAQQKNELTQQLTELLANKELASTPDHQAMIEKATIELFNLDPKAAMKVHEENPESSPLATPEAIAVFLRNPALTRDAVGEYLGELKIVPANKEQTMQILSAYTQTFEFKNKEYLPALREFLTSFKLPGEAQKIDRLMLAFAEQYIKDNPHNSSTSDDIYGLSFAVVMLNTDLHNPQNKEKMDENTFVSRAAAVAPTVSEEALKEIYHDIRNNEIKLDTGQPQPSKKAKLG